VAGRLARLLVVENRRRHLDTGRRGSVANRYRGLFVWSDWQRRPAIFGLQTRCNEQSSVTSFITSWRDVRGWAAAPSS